MQINEKFKELSQLPRNQLSLSQLWLVSKKEPQWQDGHLVENLIAQMIQKVNNKMQCDLGITREGMVKAIQQYSNLERSMNSVN